MKYLESDRLLLVSPLPPPYGGISKWTDELTKFLDGKDVRYRVLDTAVRWRKVHNKDKLIRFLFGSAQSLFLAFKLIFFIISFKPTVVHINSSGSLGLLRDFISINLCRLFRIRVILHIRFGRVPELMKNSRMEWFLFSSCFDCADKVITIDGSTNDFLYKNFPSFIYKICFIPNFIDVDKIEVANKNIGTNYGVNKLIVSYVGWIIPSKGIGELLSAVSLVDNPNISVQLTGPISDEYRAMLSLEYMNIDLIFRGEKSNSEAIKDMAASDLFVLASHTEGFPNVILEAMAVGVPIIATKVGAIPEILGDNSGRLVDVYDVPGLASTINAVIESSSQTELMVKNAHRRVRDLYDIEVVVEQYFSVWFGD